MVIGAACIATSQMLWRIEKMKIDISDKKVINIFVAISKLNESGHFELVGDKFFFVMDEVEY